MPQEVEERSGDLRAVTGTEAELQISTDRPLQGGKIQLDNGAQIQLAGGENNVYRGTVKMDKDGVYHVAGVEDGASHAGGAAAGPAAGVCAVENAALALAALCKASA